MTNRHSRKNFVLCFSSDMRHLHHLTSCACDPGPQGRVVKLENYYKLKGQSPFSLNCFKLAWVLQGLVLGCWFYLVSLVLVYLCSSFVIF